MAYMKKPLANVMPDLKGPEKDEIKRVVPKMDTAKQGWTPYYVYTM